MCSRASGQTRSKYAKTASATSAAVYSSRAVYALRRTPPPRSRDARMYPDAPAKSETTSMPMASHASGSGTR